MCSHKSYLLLIVFVANVVIMQAYTPTTWIDSTPNNLFAPLFLSNTLGEQKKSKSIQGNLRTNLFATYQQSSYGAGASFLEGVAAHGRVDADKILRGLYGEIYTPLVFSSIRNGYLRYASSATIADVPLLVGWSAIKKKRFQLDGYVLGIIPTTKRVLFHDGKSRYNIWFDDHFAWGLGSALVVHLWDRPRHKIDWLTEADVTFHEARKAAGILSSTSDGWKTVTDIPILLKRHAGQMYKIQSGLVSKFKHFVSDIGVQYFITPRIKHSFIDTTLTANPPPIDSAASIFNLFYDIGWRMRCGKFPSYVSLGANAIIPNHNDLIDRLNVTVKFGVDF